MTPQEAAITLNLIPGLGSIKIQRLLEFFGSPEIVLHAPARLLQEVKGIGNDLATSITSWKTTTNALKEIDLATQAKVSITTLFDPEYPTILRTITDPPIVLYSYGHWLPIDGEKSIAVVGSRMATHYGRMVAQKFSYSLAEAGITIISGLARGIDSTAHHAALTAGGRTLAIIGSGLNRLYPEENKALADMIVDGHGAVISEFPMNLAPSKSTFPMRNRIVSAWSQATLVIEAPKRSGALITANSANEQGRTVYAVPGPIDRPYSEGCHELIRDGATLVTHAGQILDDLGWNPCSQELPLFQTERVAQASKQAVILTGEEQLVLNNIKQGNQSLDSLCTTSGLPTSTLTGILAKLQIIGLVIPLPGGLFTSKK